MPSLFKSEQFRPTEWDTAEDKAKYCNLFAAFVKADFVESKWTKKLYTDTHQHMGFIAHYNQVGFYDEYFRNGPDRCRFLGEIMHPGIGCGQWYDVSKALQTWLAESGEAARVASASMADQQAKELALYQRLHAKYSDYQPPQLPAPELIQTSMF